MIPPSRRRLAREVADLKDRVEGTEYLLSYLFFGDADEGDPRAAIAAVTAPEPKAAAKVEHEIRRPSPAWRRR